MWLFVTVVVENRPIELVLTLTFVHITMSTTFSFLPVCHSN